MERDRYDRVKQLFHEALQLPQPDRSAFLDKSCGGDAPLRGKVEVLLAHDSNQGEFMEHPPALPPSPNSDSPNVPNRIGSFRILSQLGEGGFGVVYLAEQADPARRVALKVIKPGMDSKEVVARFEAERQALAMMNHANIASVYDAGVTPEGRPFFVMEYVQGEPITAYCDRNRLSLSKRLALFMQVCHAVQHAHQKGVIHRDLKPSNILVALHDDKPIPKVIDFGIAKAINQQQTERTIITQHGFPVGTPAYMSPEQAEIDQIDIDTRTDIYSLGVLLYELLTGTLPFETDALRSAAILEVLRVIREVDPPMPSTRLSTIKDALPGVAAQRGTEPAKLSALIRGDLDWIVSRCMEKDRTRRYETANGLAEDIQRHLNNEPVLAGPPSVRYRLRKFVRRNRRGVASASVIATMLLLSMAITIVYMDRNRRLEWIARGTQRELDVSKAKYSAQSGNWLVALGCIDTALHSASDDETLLRLLRVTALDCLVLRDEARQEIARLASRTDLGSYRGEVLLWQGEFAQRAWTTDESVPLINQSIQAGLAHDPALLAYAEGLLSDNAADATTAFHKALELNPYLQRAHGTLVMSLLLQGRLAEAETNLATATRMFPQSPDFALLAAIINVLKNQPDEAERAFRRVAATIRLTDGSTVDGQLQLIKDLLHGIKKGRDADVANDAEHRIGLQDSVDRIIRLGQQLPALFHIRLQDMPFPLLPWIRNSHGRVPSGVATMKLEPDRAASIFEQAAQHNPEGSILFLQGLALSRAKRYSEAITVLLSAYHAPAIVMDLKSDILLRLCITTSNAGVSLSNAEGRSVIALIRSEASSDLIPWQLLPHMAKVSEERDDHDLAKQIAKRAIDRKSVELEFNAATQPAADRRRFVGDLASLGYMYRLTGRNSDSEECSRRVLAFSRQTERGRQLAFSIKTLADAYFIDGRFADAEPLYAESLDLVLSERDPSVDDIEACAWDLGNALFAQQKYREAKIAFERIIDAYKNRKSETGIWLAEALNNYGIAVSRLGVFKAAEEACREAVRVAEGIQPRPTRNLAVYYSNLARQLMLQGRPHEAAVWCKRALASLEDGQRDMLFVRATCWLGLCSVAEGSVADGEYLVRDALSAHEKLPSTNGWELANTRSALGVCLAARGQFAEAEPLVLDGYYGTYERRGPSDDNRREIIQRVVIVYEKWHAAEPDKGYDVKASEWRQKLEAWQATTRPAASRPATERSTTRPLEIPAPPP